MVYHGRPRGITTWSYHGNTMWYTMVQPYHGILCGFTITQNLLQHTTVSFLDCRNCRPMYSAGMWRRFLVAGTRRTAIGENVWLHIWIFIWGRYPTSAQHPPCLPMSVCSKAQALCITKWRNSLYSTKGACQFFRNTIFMLQCNKWDICGWIILN